MTGVSQKAFTTYAANEYMQRRRFLSLIGSGGAFTVAGCLGSNETESTEQRTESANTAPASGTTPTATVSPRIRQWATDAESQGPTRPDGTPVSVDQTITDEPGYEADNIEYFPENQTVRYVATKSRGGNGYETWTFEEWGRIETATVGARRASQVTENRLAVDGLSGGILNPPNESEGVVIIVSIEKMLDRDGEVVSWPVTTFPDLLGAAPRSAAVTLTIEGDTYTRTVPVYVGYSVSQYE